MFAVQQMVEFTSAFPTLIILFKPCKPHPDFLMPVHFS